jgi:hypothetical protein
MLAAGRVHALTMNEARADLGRVTPPVEFPSSFNF